MFIVVHGLATRETLLREGISQTELVKHLGAAREEGDSSAIVVLGGLGILFDDLDVMGRTREVARKLVCDYEAYE
jgi:molybdopterin-biosynthesis enzyme MoeA-like protein